MIIKQTMLAVSLGLVLSGSVLADTIVIHEPEVRTIVTKAGYSDPALVERDGTLWRSQTTAHDSTAPVTVFVNEQGQILGAADVSRTRISGTSTTITTTTATKAEPVTEQTVATIVTNAGFHNIHDIDLLEHKGVWKAEADDITGADFEIHVDATSGRIVHVEDD